MTVKTGYYDIPQSLLPLHPPYFCRPTLSLMNLHKRLFHYKNNISDRNCLTALHSTTLNRQTNRN